ncbi:MAG: DUF2341 domain-containing protein, partial [Nanoarchaeota archaeon]|nr:DUF2341 domain-containing protein [Nanoarchaeota archaeon]
MKNKLNPKGITLKGVNILIILAIVLAIAVLVIAQTNEELEAEKALLEQELTDANYSWLIDYPADENLDVVSIEVYESPRDTLGGHENLQAGDSGEPEDGDEIIAVIENISEEGWYKTYLTGLNGTQDVFDLRVIGGGVEFDYIVDPRLGEESFEGTGYELSWSESIDAGCTLDPNSAIPGTVPPGSGSECLKSIVLDATYNDAYAITGPGDNNIWYVRGYLYLSEEGLSDNQGFFTLRTGNTADNLVAAIQSLQSGGVLYVRFQYYSSSAVQSTDVVALSLNTWYRFEYKYDITNTAWEWRINGDTQHSGALSADTRTPNRLQIGIRANSGTAQSTLYTDLVAIDDADWVGAAADTTPPYFTNGTPVNQTIYNNQSLSYDINATDETAFDCFRVNDTTNFQIDCNGLLTNKTALSVQLYNLNITINDSSNNLNSTLMWVNVTEYTDWYNSSWLYKKDITIDYTKVNGSQVNFPILINITDTDLRDDAQADGDDIVFINSTGDKLDHEIEFYNSSTGWLVAWVRMSTLSNTTNTTISMYYGNADASNQENANGVWDNNFVMVQHLSEIPGTTNITYDSTSYANNGITINMSSENQVAGQVDGSLDFDGVDDHVRANLVNNDINVSQGTANFWLYRGFADNTPTDKFYLEIGTNAANTIQLNYRAVTDLWTFLYKANSVITVVTAPPANISRDTWTQVIFVWDTTADVTRAYVNGVEVGTPATGLGVWAGAVAGTNIGSNFAGLLNYRGLIDEVRISNVARSAGWITTEYNNQFSPSTFYSVGSEETGTDTTPPYFTNGTPVNQTIYNNQSLSYDINASDETSFDCFAVNDTINFKINCSGYLENNTALSVQLYNINITINDSSNNLNSTLMWVNVTEAITGDTTPPYFTTIPNDASVEYLTDWAGVDFDATDETGFDSYTINDSRFTINSSGFLDWTGQLAVSNYYLNITINDSSNNLNSTIYNLEITTNSSLVLGLTATTPITYGTTTDFTESGCPDELTCTLNISNQVYEAGTISANYSTSGNTNYTAASAVFTVTINKAIPQGSLTNTDTWTEPYLESVTIGLSESNTGDADVTYIVYRDGVSKGTGETVTLGVGTYDYVLNTTGGTNWTSNISMDTETLTITQIASQTSLTFDAASPQTYGTAITPTCSVISGEGSAVLKMDGDIITSGNPLTLGADTYSFNCSLDSTQNYTSSSNSSDYTISKADPSTNMQITGTTPIEYLTTSDFAESETNTGDIGCSYSMDLSNQIYGVGVWTFNYSTPGCDNYTAGSVTKDLTVNKNSSLVLGLSASTPIIYGTTTNFAGSGCPAELSCALNISNAVYGGGTVSANYSTPGNTNYTAASAVFTVTINKAQTLTTLVTTPASPIEYPATSNFSCSNNESLTYIIYIDDIDKTSEKDINLIRSAGVYNVSCIATENTNYSSSSDELSYTINQNSSLVLGISGTTPITYGDTTDVAGSGCPVELSCALNISNIVYEAGITNFNYSTGGNENYTSQSVVKAITINQAIPQGSLTSDLGWTINETQEVVIGLSESNTGDTDVTYIVYRDGVSKTTGETWSPAYGTYDYVLNTTGGINWTSNISMDTETLTVNDNIYPQINLTSPNNITYSANRTELNYTYTETNCDSVWWSNNSGVWNSTREDCGVNWTGLSSVEGSNTWTVYINDTSGNENSSSVTFTVDAVSPYYITDCQTLDEENAVYYLTNSVSTTGTCFNVTANNVTLDCQSWDNQIVYGNQNSGSNYYGVVSDASNWTTVKNCEIKRGSSALSTQNRSGIYLTNNYYGEIENVNASVNRFGIDLSSSSN